MILNDVFGAGPRRKVSHRYGRGTGSGWGTTAGRGNKGNGARTGNGGKLGHEGGTMPLFRRLPRRGFNNKNFRTVYTLVNVGVLDKNFNEGDTVSLAVLRDRGLILKKGDLLKVLGDGDLSKALKVEAHAVSGTARSKIEGAKGSVQLADVKQAR